MIRPGVAAPNIAPLLGREVVRERAGVRYHELRARSLLNRCQSPRVPFDWTVNPYRGCAMGCRYCYAAYTHEFLGVSEPEAFHTVVYVKTGTEDETARRLPAIARRGQLVALGTATDPYQPGEADLRVTRRFLEAAAAVRGLRLGITTKGAVILRDIDLLRRIHERSALSVHVSLISLDADLLRRLEPLAPAARGEDRGHEAAGRGGSRRRPLGLARPAGVDGRGGRPRGARRRRGRGRESAAWPLSFSSCARPRRRSTCAGSPTSSRATSKPTGEPTTAACTWAGAIASGSAPSWRDCASGMAWAPSSGRAPRCRPFPRPPPSSPSGLEIRGLSRRECGLESEPRRG